MNPFVKNPIKVVVYDPVRAEPRRTFVFVGDVPKSVAAATDNVTLRTNERILRDFYGDHYRAALGIGQKFGASEDVDESIDISEHAGPPIAGGDSELFSDDIEELLRTDVRKRGVKPTRELERGVEYVHDVHMYPEDKFVEFKDKVHIATGIPAYRQHVLYMNTRNQYTNTYKIYADGIYPADIRRITMFADTIHGVPIDKYIYDNRESVRVEAHDSFRLLGEELFDNTVYVVDIQQFTARIATQLIDTTRDTYQFDLFYYGFVLKYWPQFTQECFLDYVINEAELSHKYPDLARPLSALEAIYRAEAEIINWGYKNINKLKRNDITMAITSMTATIQTVPSVINIRNLFDTLRLSECVPEIHAYIEHAGYKYMLRKCYRKHTDIQFPSGVLMKNGVTIAISLRKPAADTVAQSRYLFLNIWPNGKYYVKTMWNEEDEYGFDEIIRVMQKYTDPILNTINTFGRSVSTGAGLPRVSKQNVSYQALNICVFWKRVLMESAFRAMRTQWDPYLRAKITGLRNVQQFDKYEFTFRKGMHEFDPHVIEKIVTASNNIILNNHYAHLSNSAIKQKWDQNYDGRIVRMTHRTTDVRFEVTDIREREFEIFFRYISAFILRASANEKFAVVPIKSYEGVKRLKKLSEQDPELFKLKKYGSKKVYSIICQNQRQPLIYTADELRAMSATDVKKLTKYWNFTLNKPAFYGCPNRKYPHLSFMVGAHPRHYCLPCCNKKPTQEDDSRRSRVNTVCMQKHTYTDDDLSGSSRHIMNYGKEVDLGRLSKLPQSSLKNLLFGTLREPQLNYYIYGVAQNTPAIEHIGILYAIAEALDKTVEEIIGQIIDALRANDGIFSILMSGSLGEYWADVDALIATLRELFVDMRSITTSTFAQWPEFFAEMSYRVGVAIYTFIDDGALTLYVPSWLERRDIAAAHAYILVIKKQNRVHPIFVLDAERYARSFEIRQRVFHADDAVVRLIHGMIASYRPTGGPYDLQTLLDFAATGSAVLSRKYINRQNQCYAVGISDMLIPVSYSAYTDAIPVSFDVPSERADIGALLTFIAEFNKYLAHNNRMIIEPTAVMRYEGSTGTPRTSLMAMGMLFPFVGEAPAGLPIVMSRYDLDDVNKAILHKEAPADDPRKTIGAAYYNNYLYQLFTLEFVNYLDHERNEPLRKQLYDLITATNFKKDIGAFRAQLKALVAPAGSAATDNSVLQSQLGTFYYTHFDKAQLIASIKSTAYDFDRMTMNSLRRLPREELKSALTAIAAQITERRASVDSSIQFPNIYTPCDDGTQKGYCAGRKLIIDRPLEDLIDLLATDLQDDIKVRYILGNIWTDTCIDYLSFTRHGSEMVSIYRLTE